MASDVLNARAERQQRREAIRLARLALEPRLRQIGLELDDAITQEQRWRSARLRLDGERSALASELQHTIASHEQALRASADPAIGTLRQDLQARLRALMQARGSDGGSSYFTTPDGRVFRRGAGKPALLEALRAAIARCEALEVEVVDDLVTVLKEIESGIDVSKASSYEEVVR